MMVVMNWRLRWGVALVSAGVGCADLAGLDDYAPSRPQPGGQGGGAGGVLATCEAGCDPIAERCLPVPPPGWKGPAGLREECAASLPQPLADGLVGVTTAPAECTCSCSPPSGGSCPMAPAELHEDNECMGPMKSFAFAQCTNGSSISGLTPSAIRAVRGDPGTPAASGSCRAHVEQELPEVTGTAARLCAADGETSERMAATGCAPAQPDGIPYCVYAEGDQPCPTGLGYTERGILWAGTPDDTRGCSPCECAPPNDSCLSVTTVYASSGCSSTKVVAPHDGICRSWSVPGFGSVETDVTYIPGTCQPSGGSPEGGIAPEKSWTVCCTL